MTANDRNMLLLTILPRMPMMTDAAAVMRDTGLTSADINNCVHAALLKGVLIRSRTRNHVRYLSVDADCWHRARSLGQPWWDMWGATVAGDARLAAFEASVAEAEELEACSV